MDTGIPSLEVGFAIDHGGSFEALEQLDSVIDRSTANAVAEFTKVERASKGMLDLGSATASVSTFGAAATRELQTTAREMAKVERAGEGLVKQLERQAATYGKTREELRLMKVQSTAAAADAAGLTELAARIRAAQADLNGAELAASRKSQFAAEAVAQAAEEEADRVAAAKLTEIQALRSAKRAYEMFEAAAKRGMEAYREEQAAAAAAAKVAADLEARVTAEARVNAQLLERSRLEAALERTTGVGRLRAVDNGATFSALAAKAAEDEARATAAAGRAAQAAAEQHARLAAAVRDSHAAQVADVAAAERMRAATDPLYAATKRLNEELAESTRLYRAGVTAPAEYARQQEVLTGRLRGLTAAQDEHAAAVKRGTGTMTQLSFQLNDVATMAMSGATPFQIFATQAGQIFQVAQMAEGGVAGFSKEIGLLALRFGPLLVVAGAAWVMFDRWRDALSKDADLKKYAAGLGLTRDEMKKLGDQSVTIGDVFSGLWKTIGDRMPDFDWGKIVDWFADPSGLNDVATFVAQIYGLLVGGYRGIVDVWGKLPAALGDVFAQATNAVAGAIERMVNKSIGAINAFATKANGLLGIELFGQIDEITVKRVANENAGAAREVLNTVTSAIADETKKARGAMDRFGADIGTNAQAAARARLRKRADELKADRTPKADRHAEQLAREAAAMEAQIRNLYALADAYGVSGAAALIAEARVKAESAAIKKRADIEELVNRQIRLSIAQRVSDGAKTTAAVREQAAAQEEVNRLVAAGLIPAERAAELVRARIEDLPLLAAIEAAQQRGLAEEAKRATRALEDQRAARERSLAAAATDRFNAASATAADRLAELREERRLVGATNLERVRALALLKATQDARALNPGDRAAFVQDQVRIAEETERTAAAQREWNDALTFTADKWALIADRVSAAAGGMAEAFGAVGRAIGDASTTFTGYLAQQERAAVQHREALRLADSQSAVDRENARFAIASSTAQMGLYGDLTGAAKGFFREGTRGYRAMAAAEKVFRAVEFALAVKNAAVQLGLLGGVSAARVAAAATGAATDTAFTAASVANAGVRAAADGSAAMAKTAASSPFPFNLAGMAIMAAALASIGVATGFFFGGGGGNTLPKSNEGTGTVLGDADAKSESLKRSIDLLREVDTTTSVYAREMAASLRSIDGQIGGLASVLVRSGNLSADALVDSGFKANAIGSVLGALPLVGGFLKSLFGTSTKTIASGIYGGAQSLDSILAGGFEASTYSDVQKKKKFFGLTTSTKYSTVYGGAIDDGVSDQFALILRSFNDAILAAAGPLGDATDEVKARLGGFTIALGKIDLTGLSGSEIQEKLAAVFGAAADDMAEAAFPGISRLQRVGEGAFETLTRVASTVEAVTDTLTSLGRSVAGLGIDAKVAIAAQFDSVSDFTGAATAYFEAFYSEEEQAVARGQQLAKVFASMGMILPRSLAGFRQLVDAQDLSTTAGQAAYAQLLKLAPAFSDLMGSLGGAQSAPDAAAELRDAWASVGSGIMEEVRRIRGLSATDGANSFPALQAAFNGATAAALGGDLEAAKRLPGLSQSLLSAAEKAATSRQELERIRAETAARLEETASGIAGLAAAAPALTLDQLFERVSTAQAATEQASTTQVVDQLKAMNDNLSHDLDELRKDTIAGLAAVASGAGKTAQLLDDVASGGRALQMTVAQ